MSTERRDDSNADIRERLAEIDAGYKERADRNAKAIAKFAHRTFWTLVAVMVILVALGVVQVFVLKANSDRVDDIQASRVEATRDRCASDDHQNAAIRGFIAGSLPPQVFAAPLVKEYLASHRRDFPHPAAATQSGNRQAVPPTFVVKYLEDTRKAFPRVDCAARLAKLKLKH